VTRVGVCTACCSHCSARLLQPRGARWLLPQCSRCLLLARVRLVCMCMAVHVHVHVKQGQAADQVRVQQCLVINTAELSWRRGYVAPCSNGETSCARASAQEVHAGVNVSPLHAVAGALLRSAQVPLALPSASLSKRTLFFSSSRGTCTGKRTLPMLPVKVHGEHGTSLAGSILL